ncbi:MAG: beta-ketoacyl synthase [Tannerella sp.]|jgi:3-oxoacyl-[acyl-carrier-protein] synthase-1|nr:beta-ketoacyl synthase [Tannerella sp.]
MTVLLGDNIISALGFTAEENYRNVKQGVCGLTFFADRYGLQEPFMASEIDGDRLDRAFDEISAAFSGRAGLAAKAELSSAKAGLAGTPTSVVRRPTAGPNYSRLEKAAIVSVAGALKGTGIDPSDEDVLFVLSTTKGNVFLLNENEREGYEPEQLYLWRSAELIARFFGNANRPMVLSNACISGVSAMIAAQRELRSGRYGYAVVTGVDTLSEFIVTGFQSFKALSQEVCKPFDANRTGLNLGEAAATVIMTERPENELQDGDVVLTAGAMRNDANHISGPSRTGEGAYLALRKVMEGVDPDEIAFVCAHGTATLYNDEMESVALTRAGLQHVPVNSLKGYFGHTLGAAGIMESIISVRALKDKTLPGTYGFEMPGVTNPLDIITENRSTDRQHCIKMLSGFGGCNAAALFTVWGIKN